MRDTKSILLLVVSFLLLVVSCALLWTWGYRVYNNQDKKQAGNVSKDIPVPVGVRPDSVLSMSSASVALPDKKLDSIWSNADSLKGQLDTKLSEFDRLRNEINVILKDPRNNADLGMARQKIMALQQIVDELRNRNKDVENENKRLQSVLQQLSVYMKAPIKAPEQNVKQVGFEEKPVIEASTATAVFTTSDLKLSAMMVNNDKEEETLQAQQTEKLVGSFTVKNNASGQGINTELLIVVVQPDGQVLKGSAWESGVFSTAEGKRVYSYKMRVDLTRGEVRRLLFTLVTDNYQKGNYTMQLYYNGVMIGKMLKTLS